MKKVSNKKTAKTTPIPKLQVAITVNGEIREWQIAPGDLLLDVLRREGYFGVKRGCETGECGACTVLLDGKAINSCMMFAAQVHGHALLTVEGLTDHGQLDPVQDALITHSAVQCGFCSPGMALNAKALLAAHPQANETKVREALAGNLCRCTGYKKAVEAVLAAGGRSVKTETPSTHDVVGHSVRKLDAAK